MSISRPRQPNPWGAGHEFRGAGRLGEGGPLQKDCKVTTEWDPGCASSGSRGKPSTRDPTQLCRVYSTRRKPARGGVDRVGLPPQPANRRSAHYPQGRPVGENLSTRPDMETHPTTPITPPSATTAAPARSALQASFRCHPFHGAGDFGSLTCRLPGPDWAKFQVLRKYSVGPPKVAPWYESECARGRSGWDKMKPWRPSRLPVVSPLVFTGTPPPFGVHECNLPSSESP
jgi:hypothetical protein